MGCGKSILGKALASQVNISFLDLDKKIEEYEKKPVREIFELKGELYFRQIERKILLDIIGSSIPKIVSLGGGAPCYFTNMTDIVNSTHQSIYFRASIDNLVDKLHNKNHKRPLISHLKSKIDLREFISKHLFERSFFYEKAGIKINVDNKSIPEIIGEILLSLD
jgi:shikimate kinase